MEIERILFLEILTSHVKAGSVGVLCLDEQQRIVDHSIDLLHREIFNFTGQISHKMQGRDIIPVIVIVEVSNIQQEKILSPDILEPQTKTKNKINFKKLLLP